MRLLQHWDLIKHVVGAALLVRHWPSRRMMARQAAELAELRQFAYTASGCSEAVLAASQRLRNTP